jgi:WD40 repeat protein
LQRVFGRGGMSVVYLAHDRHIGREVAFKQLLGGKEGYSERFLREARVTGQLEHPGIVPVYEVGLRPDGSQYYTQKLIRGRTLQSAIDAAGGLAARLELLKHFVDLCQAVAYAHSRGVVHRDLMPENVMVGEFGETVVLDWGLAKVRGLADAPSGEDRAPAHKPAIDTGDSSRTRAGAMLGTPLYMSPEQLRGELTQVDEISDVYCLGAILFQLLTGKPPYQGKTLPELLFKRGRAAPPATSLEPEAPPELSAVAARALSLERPARYQSARALCGEVLSWMSGLHVSAYHYSSLELLQKFVRRNRAASAVAMVAALLLAVAGVWIVHDSRRAHANLAVALLEKARVVEREGKWAKAAALFAASRVEAESPEALWGSLVALGRAARPVHTTALGAGPIWATLLVPSSGPEALPEELRSGLLLGAEDGSVRLVDAATGAPRWSVQAHNGPVSALALAGEVVLTTGVDGVVRALRLEGGQPLGERAREPAAVLALAVSREGLFATCGSDGLLRLHAAAGEALGAVRVTPKPAQACTALSFSADGHALAATGDDGAGHLYAVPSLEETLRLPPAGNPSERSYAIALSPRGDLVARASGAGLITLFEVPSGKPLGDLSAHERVVEALAFSPDGARLVSASWDRTAALWDPRSLRLLARIEGAGRGLTAAAFSQSGRLLVTGSADGAARLFALPEAPVVLAAKSTVRAIAWAPDGQRLVTGDNTGEVTLWERSGARVPGFSAPRHTGSVACAAIRPGGVGEPALLATGGEDGLAQVSEATTGALRFSLRHGGAVNGLCFSPDGRTLATASEDGLLRVFDLKSGALAAQTTAADHVRDVACAPDGTRLATGGVDGTVRLFDGHTAQPLSTLPERSDKVRAVAFSAGGERLASAGVDGMIRLWDLRKEQATPLRLEGHEGLVASILFLPASGLVASAGVDRLVRLWDPATGHEVSRFTERTRQLHRLAGSPSGSHLAIGGADGQAVIEPLPDAALLRPPAPSLEGVLRDYRLELSGIAVSHPPDAPAEGPLTRSVSSRGPKRAGQVPGSPSVGVEK